MSKNKLVIILIVLLVMGGLYIKNKKAAHGIYRDEEGHTLGTCSTMLDPVGYGKRLTYISYYSMSHELIGTCYYYAGSVWSGKNKNKATPKCDEESLANGIAEKIQDQQHNLQIALIVPKYACSQK